MFERKQYLISLHVDGAYEVEICSDINDLLFKCAKSLIDDPKSSLLIHAGFLLPDPQDFMHILKNFLGNITITELASDVFFEIPTCGTVGCYNERMSGEDISILLVDREYSRTLWELISLLNTSPEWILDEKIFDLTDLPFTIRDKLSFYEIEHVQNLLEYPSNHALLCLEKLEREDLAALSKSIIKSIRRGQFLVETDTITEPQIEQPNTVEDFSSMPVETWAINADFSDPITILQRSPGWLLELEISSLIGIPIRLVHRCGYHGANKVSDMLKYTSDSMLKWDGIGETSLKEFSASIFTTIASHGDKESDKLVEAMFDVPDNSSLQFEEWVKEADLADPIAILKHSPEWLLGLDAATLVHLPVRLKNTFDGHGIEKVEDLLNYSSHSISKWPNVGKKSLVQLSRSIIATVTAGQVKDLKDDEAASQLINSTLRGLFNDALDSLTERESKILRMRLGYDRNKSMTLEEIGREFSVTRERIRQVEAKAKSKLKTLPIWRDRVIESKITGLMSHRVEPCYLDLISIEDDWFEGFSSNTKCLGTIIEDACNKKLKPISIGGRNVISRIDGEDWDQAEREVLSILDARLSSQLTKDDILLLIESHLGKYGAQELTSILFDKISSQLHFVLSEGGEDELASIGRRTSSIVLPILKASSVPLHYSDVHSRCLEMGYELDIRRVHNALSDVSWLFSLGTYGLRKHLQLSKPEESELLSQLEDIILSGDPDRQWNSAVLTEQLCNQFPGTPEIVDKYVVNIILDNSNLLTFLGRFIWVRSEQAKKQNISRIDLQEASTALIEKKGRPMSTKELKSQIMKQRGMGEYFCLKVTKSITRIAPNVWGLIGRDFYLNRSQINLLLDHMYSILLSRNSGVYIDHIRQIVAGIDLHIPSELTNHMIFYLAQTESRFVARRGQILALSEWPDARLLTIREASCKAASELSEFNFSDDLRARVEELIGRKVSESQQFNVGIIDAEFVYDDLKRMWVKDKEK